jgi:multicomponent K+:H+ antiporter subunit F
MIEFAASFALGAIAVSILLNLYRLLVGPDPTDRALALDTMVINSIGLIVLMGILFATTMYFEAALIFAMVGFLTTVAFCKYFLRGNVIE